ncbi:hypothetical protein EYF80_004969 [Liparis tanakae]|uniref:Uncharacterized protein n=1 Tax=Liparis tanakae TaxID=230148 RepID=A0A4Z2J4V3_9TELE|nr:hypothetical protein EYF80_004969 [Liparis tanakae]
MRDIIGLRPSVCVGRAQIFSGRGSGTTTRTEAAAAPAAQHHLIPLSGSSVSVLSAPPSPGWCGLEVRQQRPVGCQSVSFHWLRRDSAKDAQQPDVIRGADVLRFMTLAHIRCCFPLTELASKLGFVRDVIYVLQEKHQQPH